MFPHRRVPFRPPFNHCISCVDGLCLFRASTPPGTYPMTARPLSTASAVGPTRKSAHQTGIATLNVLKHGGVMVAQRSAPASAPAGADANLRGRDGVREASTATGSVIGGRQRDEVGARPQPSTVVEVGAAPHGSALASILNRIDDFDLFAAAALRMEQLERMGDGEGRVTAKPGESNSRGGTGAQHHLAASSSQSPLIDSVPQRQSSTTTSVPLQRANSVQPSRGGAATMTAADVVGSPLRPQFVASLAEALQAAQADTSYFETLRCRTLPR